MSKFNPETENWKAERRKQMLSNEIKNEIIEMLRCPTCGGAKYVSHPLVANNTEGKISVSYFPTGCSTCNGTGIRLPEKLPVGDGITDNTEAIQSLYNKPEKVEEPTINQSDDNIANIEIYKPEKVEEKSCNFIRTGKGCHDCVNQIPAHLNDGNYCGIDMAQECPENMFSHYEEKSCGNCKWTDIPNEWEPCVTCISARPSIKNKNWQLKEQSEDIIQLKFKINQLENALSEKEKEFINKNTELASIQDYCKDLESENKTMLSRLSKEEQRNTSFENVRQQLYAEIKEKDKKIEKLKFDVAYWQARALQNGKPNTNYRVIETTTEALKDGE